MLYRLSNEFEFRRFFQRAKTLYRRGSVVELKEKKSRTLPQNSYLHVMLSYFATQIGESTEYVKRHYFKEYVNPDIFITHKIDPLLKQRVGTLKSSSELTTEEMTLAIDRFRNWSAKTAGIYIPSSSDVAMIREMEVEISKNQAYI